LPGSWRVRVIGLQAWFTASSLIVRDFSTPRCDGDRFATAGKTFRPASCARYVLATA
jgi:hypothetical protein